MSEFYMKCKERLRKEKRKIIFSLCSAFLLIVATYFTNNLSVFTGESKARLYITQKVCDRIGVHNTINYGNTIFYNVGYDKALIPVTFTGEALPTKTDTMPENIDSLSERINTLGNRAITDRKTLLDFLKLLERSNVYKYIIVDVTFDKRDHTPYDKELFSQIKKMRDVAVGIDYNNDFPDSSLIYEGKAAYVSYMVTGIKTYFTRWEYLSSKQHSMPLLAYEGIYKNIHEKCYGKGFFSIYTLGGKPCQNTSYLTLDNNCTNGFFYKIDLGNWLMDPYSSPQQHIDDLKVSTKDKVVIIGDFINDLCGTYVGEVPGSILIARALATLEEEKNIVNPLIELLWFLTFFSITLFIKKDKSITKRIPLIRKIPYKIVHFTFSLLTFSTVLVILSTIEYIVFDRITSLVLPLVFFTVLKLIIQFNKYDQYEVN